MSTLFGMRIIESPLLPMQRMTLSDKVLVSDQFRTEFNKWLLDFFGATDCMMVDNNTMIVSYQKANDLRVEANKHNEYGYFSREAYA